MTRLEINPPVTGRRRVDVNSRLLNLFLIATSLLTAVPGGAHDFWIQPSTFRPAVGNVVTLRLRVGEHYAGDPVLRNNSKLESFEVVTSKGRQQIPGEDKSDPAGEFRVSTKGSILVSYRSKPSFVELTPATLDQYIEEEGLGWIREMRIKRGETEKPWKEGFSRCAKSLLTTETGSAKGFDQSTGLRLELIPEKDPSRLAANGKMPLRLLFEGKPLQGTLIVAINEREPSKRIEARSDGAGRVNLQLPLAGNWMIKAVHVVPAPAGMDADWESLWASLTFQAGKLAR